MNATVRYAGLLIAPGEVTVMVAVYRPGARPAVAQVTVTSDGAMPDVELTLNQDTDDVVNVQSRSP